MTHNYKHTQVGYLMLTIFIIIPVVLGPVMLIYGFSIPGISVIIVDLIFLALFATLKVTIENDFIKICFGIGLISKKFALKDIVSCKAVKTPWYYGWGIRLTPRGWLFNVSGYDAVEIEMKNKKYYRIGTDVPSELESAIKKNISKK